jgi:hypothetical protein
MKKSDFIKKVLKHDINTVFVDEAIVERTLEIFEDLGMLPPKSLDTITLKKGLVRGYTMMFEWEPEDEKK